MLLVFGLVGLLLLSVGSVIALKLLSRYGHFISTPEQVLAVGVFGGALLILIGAAVTLWAMLVNAQYRAPVAAQVLQVVGAMITASAAAATLLVY